MKLEIFNVEHGQCSLVTTDEGGHILIDCGHNASSGWTPSNHLKTLGIGTVDRLVITNCDEDHASDLATLRKSVEIKSLRRNATINKTNLLEQKSLGGIGKGISALSEMLESYVHPVQANPKIDNVPISSFYNAFGVDFEDENDLSVAFFIEISSVTFCFPGDMTKRAWLKLLEKDGFREQLKKVTVFVASHHGRQDGCCDDLYTVGGLQPTLTIVSDGGKQYASQETVDWYRNRTVGLNFDSKLRKVLTTRSDGNITFTTNALGSLSVTLG